MLTAVVPMAAAAAHGMAPQALANLVHGLGALAADDDAVTRVVAPVLSAVDGSERPPDALFRMSPQELASFAWGYARLRRAADDAGVGAAVIGGPAVLMGEIEYRAEGLIRRGLERGRAAREGTGPTPPNPELATDFDQQNLANLLWAFATLEHRPGAGLLDAVEALVRTRNFARTMTDQSLSSLLWALGRVGAVFSPVALETLLRRALSLSDRLSGQSTANIVWALARLGCTMQALDPTLVFSLAKRAVQLRGELKTQEVSNLQWGFARIGARFTQAQLQQLEARYIELTQVTAPASYAGAVSTIADALLFSAGRAARGEGERADGWDASAGGKEVAGDGGGGQATAGVEASTSLARVAHAAVNTKPEEVGQLVWSYAVLAEPLQRTKPALYAHLSTQILGLCPEMSLPQLARLLWSLAVMTTLDSDDLGHILLGRALERCDATDDATMCQLHQVFMAVDQMPLDNARAERMQDLVFHHRDYVDACAAQFKATSARVGALARAEKGQLADRVFEALRALAPEATQEVVLGRECGHYAVDSFAPGLGPGGAGVAVEFDGPHHYTFGIDKYVSNRPRLNGASLLKQRTVWSGGTAMVNIPYYEWCTPKVEADPGPYLRRKIAAARQPSPKL